MEKYLVYIIPVVILVLVFLIYYLLKTNQKNIRENSIDITGILDIIDIKNVDKIDYIRNKIVINFFDVKKFNVEELHSLGVKGVSVVGDKIKFYVSDESEINKKVYESIKAFIEGK